MTRKLALLLALALPAGFTGTARADEIDWTLTQQCVQFDGTLLAEGEYRIVWPDETVGANGFVVPDNATGSLLNGTPWPCAPLEPTTEPAPEPPTTVQASRVDVAKFAGNLG